MKCSNCGYELPNKTEFLTNEQRVCPKCGQVYYYEENPIDFKKVQYGKIYRAYDNSEVEKKEV